ncbi:DUF1310 domain-containing protein [Listeria monocytogenes]|uniref:DUF1310 domain-containing protein n=4 Tax=Listeria monocytogenes TaxID=1639 RepID=A0A2Z5C3F3_LISMN|nr:DUF1310 domain-containing protein [Listeria monocytogenes]EAE3705115.1 DUF1310 family protein [Listeria monocytogenes serotype 1/2b]EAF3075979.1 DUF1310 family protein [Listeria monocytogenes serotype 1/2a]EAF4509421.1 DUF1310 family protein [Listeria monocytogenes serotype 4b]EAG6253825.1 DUF1310 family protein [Listeria monocytogenes CFSAN003806]EAG6262744.1 DUF1310 family protein [Listeria monocytogenes CFSAN003725]EAG6332726.1 DUF1310 family protein [Listeria monocytogenes CFSAN002346]
MKKRWIILFGIAIMIIFGLGIKFYMDEEKLNTEMMNVVCSNEAKEVFNDDIKLIDTKAFTKEGLIQSYEVDKESIEPNPMGGIIVALVINKDPALKLTYTLKKNNEELKSGGASISKELTKQLGLLNGYK